MNTLSLSLWAANLELPAENLNAWVATVEARMAEAQAADHVSIVDPEEAHL